MHIALYSYWCFYRLYLKRKFFQRCDLDGDGKLDYQEFKAMILRSKQRKEEIAQKKGDFLPTPKKKQKTNKKKDKRKQKQA